MRTYMILVIFLGYNGVIDAFLLARGKESLPKYNYLSLPTTALYLAATVALTYMGLGATGLFLGNIFNMALRTTLCWFLEVRNHITFSSLVSEIRPSALYLVTTLMVFLSCHSGIGHAQSWF